MINESVHEHRSLAEQQQHRRRQRRPKTNAAWSLQTRNKIAADQISAIKLLDGHMFTSSAGCSFRFIDWSNNFAIDRLTDCSTNKTEICTDPPTIGYRRSQRHRVVCRRVNKYLLLLNTTTLTICLAKAVMPICRKTKQQNSQLMLITMNYFWPVKFNKVIGHIG